LQIGGVGDQPLEVAVLLDLALLAGTRERRAPHHQVVAGLEDPVASSQHDPDQPRALAGRKLVLVRDRHVHAGLPGLVGGRYNTNSNVLVNT
jgi:hypothetical protein